MKPARSLSKLVTQNLGLKLLALAAAVTLFSLIHSEQDAERTMLLDVVAILPEPGSDKTLVSELPEQVKVRLRGSRSRINGLDRNELGPVQMDLTDTSRQYYYFDAQSIEVPAAVTVTDITPATVALTWSEAATRTVPIKVRLTGQPGDGLQVREPVKVAPPKVTLRGAASQVESLSAVYTEVVVLDGLGKGTHELRVPLERLPRHVSYNGDIAVKVTVEIVPALAERTFGHLELAAVGEGDLTFRPAHVAVTLRGDARRLPAIDAEHLVPYVDVTGAEEALGTTPQPVKVRGVPEGFEVVKISPEDVLVRQAR